VLSNLCGAKAIKSMMGRVIFFLPTMDHLSIVDRLIPK
jgi:hypothetical protein